MGFCCANPVFDIPIIPIRIKTLNKPDLDFGRLNPFPDLNNWYKTGSTTSVSKVAEINPPTTTVASGFCTSAPAEPETAIGKNPKAAADAVSKTGLSRSLAPIRINSLMSLNLVSIDLKCSIITMPFSTAIPKSAMNPTPAEILNGISLAQSKSTPPIAESGIAE